MAETARGTNQKRTTGSRSRAAGAAPEERPTRKNTASTAGQGQTRRRTSKTAQQPIPVRGRSSRAAAQRDDESVIKRDIIIITLFAAMIFLFLSNFGILGPVGNFFSGVMFGLVGFTAYILPVFIFVAVLFYYANKDDDRIMVKLWSAIVLFLVFGIICELTAGRISSSPSYDLVSLYKTCADHRNGGGIIAGSFAYLFYSLFGTFGTVLVLIIVSVICIVLISQRSLIDFVGDTAENARVRHEERMRELEEEARYAQEAMDREEDQAAPEAMPRSRTKTGRIDDGDFDYGDGDPAAYGYSHQDWMDRLRQSADRRAREKRLREQEREAARDQEYQDYQDFRRRREAEQAAVQNREPQNREPKQEKIYRGVHNTVLKDDPYIAEQHSRLQAESGSAAAMQAGYARAQERAGQNMGNPQAGQRMGNPHAGQPMGNPQAGQRMENPQTGQHMGNQPPAGQPMPDSTAQMPNQTSYQAYQTQDQMPPEMQAEQMNSQHSEEQEQSSSFTHGASDAPGKGDWRTLFSKHHARKPLFQEDSDRGASSSDDRSFNHSENDPARKEAEGSDAADSAAVSAEPVPEGATSLHEIEFTELNEEEQEENNSISGASNAALTDEVENDSSDIRAENIEAERAPVRHSAAWGEPEPLPVEESSKGPEGYSFTTNNDATAADEAGNVSGEEGYAGQNTSDAASGSMPMLHFVDDEVIPPISEQPQPLKEPEPGREEKENFSAEQAGFTGQEEQNEQDDRQTEEAFAASADNNTDSAPEVSEREDSYTAPDSGLKRTEAAETEAEAEENSAGQETVAQEEGGFPSQEPVSNDVSEESDQAEDADHDISSPSAEEDKETTQIPTEEIKIPAAAAYHNVSSGVRSILQTPQTSAAEQDQVKSWPQPDPVPSPQVDSQIPVHREGVTDIADSIVPEEENALQQEEENEEPAAASSTPGGTSAAGASQNNAVSAPAATAANVQNSNGAVSPHGETHPAAEEREQKADTVRPRPYIFPPMDLLREGPKVNNADSANELRETALKLQNTLKTFGVNVHITDISQGPAVTRYEMQPEQGVKVSKIVGLQDDIKLALAATDIRIEAPIPGKPAVGIEVPNKTTNMVALRDVLDSPEFRSAKSKTAFGVGKDIAGKIVVADIAKMPHLLIAGATGSGKSVCINTIIMSIIYHASPEEVKMIMIDPKVVELSVYNGIPHLLLPVVTDSQQAAKTLNWCVAEMEARFHRFANAGVRDIKGYNALVKQKEASGESDPAYHFMPHVVIIVDELADLMMVAKSEVETAICRLAQLARAAGMHLIIATQRPSVDVITGLIKANMPSRIAFAVTQGVDSRTILDMNGAEKLLGKGDMLFFPQGLPKPQRIQGAFVSDEEVTAVVDFLKTNDPPAEDAATMQQKLEHIANASDGGDADASSEENAHHGPQIDELFHDAGKFIIEKNSASIGLLQRMFRIGFNRAARIMDQLCDAGVVSESEGTKPRKILMTEAEFEQYCQDNL